MMEESEKQRLELSDLDQWSLVKGCEAFYQKRLEQSEFELSEKDFIKYEIEEARQEQKKHHYDNAESRNSGINLSGYTHHLDCKITTKADWYLRRKCDGDRVNALGVFIEDLTLNFEEFRKKIEIAKADYYKTIKELLEEEDAAFQYKHDYLDRLQKHLKVQTRSKYRIKIEEFIEEIESKKALVDIRNKKLIVDAFNSGGGADSFNYFFHSKQDFEDYTDCVTIFFTDGFAENDRIIKLKARRETRFLQVMKKIRSKILESKQSEDEDFFRLLCQIDSMKNKSLENLKATFSRIHTT